MVAIVSDLHSNLEALEAVLADMDGLGIKKIICLGDIVGYGPDPGGCVDAAIKFGTAICGNHDAALFSGTALFTPMAAASVTWTAEQLGLESSNKASQSRQRFLKGLPRSVNMDGNLLVHGSPRYPTDEYVFPADAQKRELMRAIFSGIKSLCFAGHTHIPGVFQEDRREFIYPSDVDRAYTVRSSKALVNVGSVGQPRDGDPRACYVTFDGETVVFRRVKYDVEKTMAKIGKAKGLHQSFADRLKIGR